MNLKKPQSKDLYYTKDHEWIDFQGSVAYIGVGNFKRIGFKEIHQIRFKEFSGVKKKAEVIAIITYNDYQIEARMPVDGKIIHINELISGNQNYLLQNAENNGWIALIVHSQPYEKKGLMLPRQYQLNVKGKHAK